MTGWAPAAVAVPTFFDVRYEFTSENIFLASFGVQATVSGVARYSLDQADQLPDDTHAGRYDLISHRVTVDGAKATDAPTSFGYYFNAFEVGNDIGYAQPPPWTDVFGIGSSFNESFGAGLTLTEVRLFGLDESGTALASDDISQQGVGRSS